MNGYGGITVDPAFQVLIPPLTEEERAGLVRKLVAEGCQKPMEIWPHDGKDYLIGGYHSYAVCRDYRIRFGRKYIHGLPDRKAVFNWIIENQLGKRDLTDFERVELSARYHGWTAEKARENQLSGLRRGNVSPSVGTGHGVDMAQEIAEFAGVGRTTAVRALAVMRNGSADTVGRARGGKVSINQAYRETMGKGE